MTQGIQLSMLNLSADSSMRLDSTEPDMAGVEQVRFGDVMGEITLTAKSGQGKDPARQIPAAISGLSGISQALQAAAIESSTDIAADTSDNGADPGVALAASILAQIELKHKAKPTEKAVNASEKPDASTLLADNGKPEADWKLSLISTVDTSAERNDGITVEIINTTDSGNSENATDGDNKMEPKVQQNLSPLNVVSGAGDTAEQDADALIVTTKLQQSDNQTANVNGIAVEAKLPAEQAANMTAAADGPKAASAEAASQIQKKPQSGPVDGAKVAVALVDIGVEAQNEADANAMQPEVRQQLNSADLIATAQNSKEMSSLRSGVQVATETAAAIRGNNSATNSAPSSTDNAVTAETVLLGSAGQTGGPADKDSSGGLSLLKASSQQNLAERGAFQQQGSSQQGTSQQGTSQQGSSQQGASQHIAAQQSHHEQFIQQQVSAQSDQSAISRATAEPAARPESMFGQTLQSGAQRQQNAQLEKAQAKSTTQQLQQSLNLLQQDAATNLRERVSLMVRQNVQVAEIRLDPAGLGQMQIKIDMQQDQASVQFIVQQPQAKELLEQQLPRLRELLQQQGIQLAEGQVQQQSQQQEQRMAQRNNHRQAESAGLTEGSDDNLPGAVAVKVVHSERLVDYYA